jgi:hypothetical protein
VQGWKSADVDFGIHFGDILDGFQAREGKVTTPTSPSQTTRMFCEAFGTAVPCQQRVIDGSHVRVNWLSMMVACKLQP